jgi:hypothetical protein
MRELDSDAIFFWETSICYLGTLKYGDTSQIYMLMAIYARIHWLLHIRCLRISVLYVTFMVYRGTSSYVTPQYPVSLTWESRRKVALVQKPSHDYPILSHGHYFISCVLSLGHDFVYRFRELDLITHAHHVHIDLSLSQTDLSRWWQHNVLLTHQCYTEEL